MPSDTPADPVECVHRFCAAWSGGDIDAIVGCLAPDVEWENVPIGVLRGRDAARERIAAAFANARAIRWDLLALAVAEDGAVLTERLDVIDTGTGEVRLRIMGIFRVGRDGITLWRDYFDGASYLRDLEHGRSGAAA